MRGLARLLRDRRGGTTESLTLVGLAVVMTGIVARILTYGAESSADMTVAVTVQTAAAGAAPP